MNLPWYIIDVFIYGEKTLVRRRGRETCLEEGIGETDCRGGSKGERKTWWEEEKEGKRGLLEERVIEKDGKERERQVGKKRGWLGESRRKRMAG